MLILLLACTDPALQLDGVVDNGATLYQAECTLCHGTAGEGTSRGPALAGLAERQAASITVDIVRNGGVEMPAYSYSDQELADLLAFLHTL